MKTTLTTVLPLVGVGQNPGSSILGLLESLRSGIVADQLGGITGIAVAGGALIAAVVLLIFGTGSIQGFAKTLLLGVVVSMFSAILVTRFLMNRFVNIGCVKESLYTKAQAGKEVQA